MKAMQTTATYSNPLGRALLRVGLVTALILSVPLVAMQFSDEVDWNLFDFIVMGVLLGSTGLAYELVVRRVTDVRQRFILAALLLGALLLIWAELAVGVFGSPYAGS